LEDVLPVSLCKFYTENSPGPLKSFSCPYAFTGTHLNLRDVFCIWKHYSGAKVFSREKACLFVHSENSSSLGWAVISTAVPKTKMGQIPIYVPPFSKRAPRPVLRINSILLFPAPSFYLMADFGYGNHKSHGDGPYTNVPVPFLPKERLDESPYNGQCGLQWIIMPPYGIGTGYGQGRLIIWRITRIPTLMAEKRTLGSIRSCEK